MRVGDQLAGRYRLDQRLGQGGMGEVWRGHDLNLDRAVAVKVLLEAATNDEVVARFRREATIGARLQHPGITVVHDVGQQDGRLFIVMELLSGEDLASVLSRDAGGLPERTALDLAAQTAEALAAAHEQAVVHRDLKPGNLFLLPGGRLKICDFGIAHSSDATAGWTVTGRIFGTPAYMAPEQWRGQQVDARCDLYALGCVLYALLSGEPPFGTNEGPYVLMRRHIEDEPTPLRVGPELDALVRALLAKEPVGRPESAQAVAKTLRGLLEGAAASASALSSVSAAEVVTAPVGAPAVDSASTGPEGGPEGIPRAVRDFVRELLLEAEETLNSLAPGAGDHRAEGLALAADAAARFDAGLAGRLLADAEQWAWIDGEGDGGRVAGLLTGLARRISEHAPARTERVLTDAQQALFTVFGSDRESRLRKIAEELAAVSAERGAELARRHFSDSSAEEGILARAAVASARTDPELAEQYLSRIQNAVLRTATEAKAVTVVARKDLPGALRLAERIPLGGGRVRALCRAADERAAAGDPAGAAEAVARAEQAYAHFVEDRAVRLREQAARHTEQGLLVQAEQLRNRAVGILRRDARSTGDVEVDAARAALADAREPSAPRPRPRPDLEAARERAAAARALGTPRERGRELAWIARDCTSGTPWLPEAAADPGSPPPYSTAPVVSAESRARPNPREQQVAPGGRRWHTGSRPDALHATGDGVVWTAGGEVGSVRADTGGTRWTAYADDGVLAPPQPGQRRVSCAADPYVVLVVVESPAEGADGAATGRRLLAREPADGRVRWWRKLPGTGTVAVHLAEGLALLLAGGELTALHKATGEPVWRYPLEGGGTPKLTLAGDRVVLSHRMLLTALRLSDGQPLWAWPRNVHPVVGPDLSGGPVYLLDGGTVRALHRREGRQLWHFEVGSPSARMLVEGNTVYTASYLSEHGWDTVVAQDAQTGAVRWQRTVNRRNGNGGKLELVGVRQGVLYVKAAHGGRRGLLGRPAQPFVTGLDVVSGKPRWHWENPGIGVREAVLAGDSIVLPLPELTAIALP